MPVAVPRCPICCNAGWHRRGAIQACTHCELEIDADIPLGPLRGWIAAALPTAGRQEAQGTGWRLPPVALRNAAWALGACWEAGKWRAQCPVPHDIVLGVIGRPDDLAAITVMAGRGDFAQTICVLDTEGAPPTSPLPTLHIFARPLHGNFGAQRNHLQALAAERHGPCWVLQLDTDEHPSPALLRSLGWMVRAAERDGLRSIGLPRRNLVDGEPSALFPDIQYRLNRSDIRFRSIVHERPEVPFLETTLGLAGPIEHRLDRARVLARSRQYEAMQEGAGRGTDEQALLQPFDAAWLHVA